MTGIKVKTDNRPRDIIEAWELTQAEQAEFDYLDWPAIKSGKGSASFFRYRGELYDLGQFMAGPYMSGWDGYLGETYFSAIVVRYVNDNEQVVVGVMMSLCEFGGGR